MANQHTILPPVVIAGLYKQVVIPKEEAAMLAEAHRASGGLAESGDLDTGSIPDGTTNTSVKGKGSTVVTAGGVGSGPVRTATDTTAGNEQVAGSNVAEVEGSKVGGSATTATLEGKRSEPVQPATDTKTASAKVKDADAVQSATGASTPIAKSAGTPNVSDIAMDGKLPNTSAGKTETSSAPGNSLGRVPEPTISTGSSRGSNPSLSGSTMETISGNDGPEATTQGFPDNSGGSTPAPGTSSQGLPSPYKILGKNLRHVTIIVSSKKEPFLPEDHLQFLTKMLSACQLNLGDVAIVNDATQKAEIQALKAQLEPARLLLFGVAPAEIGLPLTFPLFKEQEYAGCSYLYSPSLLELNQPSAEARDLKKKLWECLKKMFNV